MEVDSTEGCRNKLALPRFAINLVELDDDGKTKNIILHLRPTFDEPKHVILRNTNIMGHWGPFERDGGCPLELGKNFEAAIVVHDECYKVGTACAL